MRHYFLGAAANYTRRQRWAHTFAIGRKKDCEDLKRLLEAKYGGEAILCKNGRSGLALALKAYFNKGDAVIVNGFTCYAVYEAVKAAGLVPIFADISRKDLNFDVCSIGAVSTATCSAGHEDSARAARSVPEGHAAVDAAPDKVKGIIVQNTLGNPVDIVAIEKFAEKHGLTIIEDLAHCTGVRYADGREAGTIGAATILSFGKEKSIDTISGGAVVLRHPRKKTIQAPSKAPRPSDALRARFYPLFGAMYRGLSYIHLSGALMRLLLTIHWVEKSADNKLDLTRKISKFEAKMALKQIRGLKKSGEPPIREFYLVRDRDEVLKRLEKAGYYFGGFWYEKPVSPERYYKKVHFDEQACPVSTEVTSKIINFPTYYSKRELEPARKIIKDYLEKEVDE